MVLCWLGWDLCYSFSFILLEDDRGISAITLFLKTWICSNMINILENNLHNANFELTYAQFCLQETQGEWALKTAHSRIELHGDTQNTHMHVRQIFSSYLVHLMSYEPHLSTPSITTFCLISYGSPLPPSQ